MNELRACGGSISESVAIDVTLDEGMGWHSGYYLQRRKGNLGELIGKYIDMG
jgi:hypothetical protein